MSYFSKIKHLFFLALIISVFLAQSISSKRYSSEKIRSRTAPQDPIVTAAEKFGDSYRKCLLNRLVKASKIWEEIQPAIDSCLDKKFLRALDFHRMKIDDVYDHLYFVLPTSDKSSCVAVRLNINYEARLQDLKPEKTLRSLLPQCKFYGAGFLDEKKFRPVGKFYKKITSVIEPPMRKWDVGNGILADVDSPLYPFMAKTKTLLEKTIKERRIDYLWLHPGGVLFVDGYGVPNTAFDTHSILTDTTNVTVCQVMIWSIMFQKENGIDILARARPLFKNRYLSILSKSQFLPLKSEYLKDTNWLDVFYFNLRSPYCVKKFLAPAFCQGEYCPVEDEDEDYDYDFIVHHE